MKSRRSTILIAAVLGVIGALGITASLTQVAVAGGTITTCDDAHLATALSGGGLVTFNCGAATLSVTSQKIIAADTTIDGSNNGQPLTLTASGGVQLFFINSGVELTLTNLTVANVSYASAAIQNNFGQLIVSNSHFSNNQNGVFQSTGPMTVTQSVFTGTTSNAAIYIAPSYPLSVISSQFFSNTGGAISAQGPTVIDNSQFAYNTAPVNTGAIYMRYSTGGPLTVTNSSFISNTGYNGGAIVSYGGNTIISATNFFSNATTGGYGPGLWFQASSASDVVQIWNSTLQGNSGGAISSNGGNATFVIANTHFIDNHGGDGAVDIPNMNAVTITNSSFVSNATTYNNFPGALLLTAPAWITGTNFINNSGPQGGAFYMSGIGKSVFITNTQFLTNTSTTYDGGAIRDYSGNLNLFGVTVSGNRALAGYGGGLWASDPNSSLNIDHSLFYNNVASSPNQGGAMYLYGFSSIANSTIFSNAAYAVGGIGAQRDLTLTNVTIVSNTASYASSGGNLQATGLTPGVIVNTIIAGGSPRNCSIGNPTSLGYNLSDDATCVLTGTKDLTGTNPLLGPFQNNGGPTFSFVPTANSLAVNGGNNAYCSSTDQRGVARPIGPACDIGAVESPYVLTPQAITFNPLPDKLISDPPFAITATASSGLPVAFNSGGVCSVSGITVTLSGIVGSCTITATQAGNGVYAPAMPVVNRFNVSGSALLTQTITFNSLPDRKISASPFVVTATASSGLVVTFTTSTILNCTATGTNGSTITLIHVGTCTVVAHQAGNATYAAAADVPRSFQITNSVIFLPVVLKDF